MNFQNIFLIYLWVLLCFKVGDNKPESEYLFRIQAIVWIPDHCVGYQLSEAEIVKVRYSDASDIWVSRIQIPSVIKFLRFLNLKNGWQCHMFKLRRLSLLYRMSSNVFTNKGTNWSFPNEIKNLKATRFPVLNLHLKNNAKMIFMRIKKLEIISSLHFLIDHCHQSVKLLLHLYVKEDCVTNQLKWKDHKSIRRDY